MDIVNRCNKELSNALGYIKHNKAVLEKIVEIEEVLYQRNE
ncbi:hypothetical protein [Staphylococcus hominis]|nr:hypothetical protein [Staphylococcus hominis]